MSCAQTGRKVEKLCEIEEIQAVETDKKRRFLLREVGAV